MGLVDRQKIDRNFPQGREDVVAQQPFRRDVEKSERAVAKAKRDPATLVGVGGGIEARRVDAKRPQLGDLIAHERDKRRHDEGQAPTDDGRKLEAKRLAAACRHHRQHVLAFQRGRKHIFLPGAEGGKAEDASQSRARLRHKLRIWRHKLALLGSKTGVHCTDSTPSAPVASIMRRSKPSAAPLASGISASALKKSTSIGYEVP